MTTNNPTPYPPRPATQKTNDIRRGGQGTSSNVAIKGKHKRFNSKLNFTQINLNKKKQGTKDLYTYIQNVDKPLVLVQEPHVDGKGVISRVSSCIEV